MKIKERELINEGHPIVEQMEKEWPEMTKEFRRLQREQYELFLKKQHDSIALIMHQFKLINAVI